MRETKFRAWDKKNKKWNNDIVIWTNGNLCTLNIGGDMNLIPEECNERFEICFYAGLKDKNKKEIYEGDIVKTNSHYYGSWKTEVIFRNGCFGFDAYNCVQIKNEKGWKKSLKKTFPNEKKNHDQVKTVGFVCSSFYPLLGDGTYSRFNLKDCEVIGNKFENPKLLEEKK